MRKIKEMENHVAKQTKRTWVFGDTRKSSGWWGGNEKRVTP